MAAVASMLACGAKHSERRFPENKKLCVEYEAFCLSQAFPVPTLFPAVLHVFLIKSKAL